MDMSKLTERLDSWYENYSEPTPTANEIKNTLHGTLGYSPERLAILISAEAAPSLEKMAEIAQEKPTDSEIRIYSSLYNGDPNTKADIAIIGEGYTADEDQKFQDDLKRFTEVFFLAEPCKSNKNKFNIRGVLKPSVDSGIDETRAGIDKNTP